MTYRADIDGIRAIAIFCVLLFHLKLDWFRGGYIGVDIFYVISGFLVSGQILSRMESGRFQFGEFYSSRARRLFPALFVTIILTFIAAAWLMLPVDFERFALSAVAALGSVSNVVFFMEAGYWDITSDYKPLLHTWSLGVEEQFYLFWPLAMLALFKWFNKSAWVNVMAAVTVVGLVLSEWMVRENTSAAFYLSPFRIFQFSAGALVFLLLQPGQWLYRLAQMPMVQWGLFGAAGLATLYGCWKFSGSTPFPGVSALLPTLVTMALLVSGASSTFIGTRLMALPPAVWVGKVSYSLYLVHWPIVSLYLYHNGAHVSLTPLEQVQLFFAILIAAVLMHYGVERVFYRRSSDTSSSGFSERRVLTGLAGTFVLLLAIGVHARVTEGWTWRFPDMTVTPADIHARTEARFEKMHEACLVAYFDESDRCNREAPHQVLVIGNSLEVDGYNFLYGGYGSRSDLNLTMTGGFLDCLGTVQQVDGRWTSSLPRCDRQLSGMFNPAYVEKLDTVVLSVPYPFSVYSDKYLRMIQSLRAQRPALDIVVFGSYLYLRRECSYFVQKQNDSKACVEPDNIAVLGLDMDEFSLRIRPEYEQLGYRLIDRMALLCGETRPESCAHAAPSGEPLYWDVVHTSLDFALWSGEQFAKRYPDYLTPAQP